MAAAGTPHRRRARAPEEHRNDQPVTTPQDRHPRRHQPGSVRAGRSRRARSAARARLAGHPPPVGRRRPRVGRAPPCRHLRHPRSRRVHRPRNGVGVQPGPVGRRPLRRHRRGQPGPQGAPRRPRLGLGAGMGGRVPRGRRRADRHVHVHLRPQPGPPGRVGAGTTEPPHRTRHRSGAQPTGIVGVHGVLHDAGGAAAVLPQRRTARALAQVPARHRRDAGRADPSGPVAPARHDQRPAHLLGQHHPPAAPARPTPDDGPGAAPGQPA